MAEGEYISPFSVKKPPNLGNHQMDKVWRAILAERDGMISPQPLREVVRIEFVEDPALPEAQIPLF